MGGMGIKVNDEGRNSRGGQIETNDRALSLLRMTAPTVQVRSESTRGTIGNSAVAVAFAFFCNK